MTQDICTTGEAFDFELLVRMAGEPGVVELVERGLVLEPDPGVGQFRHSLTREAIYADIPCIRRRQLHRRLAEEAEATGGSSAELATHWLGAREETRAREALLRAVEEFCGLHAYLDAAVSFWRRSCPLPAKGGGLSRGTGVPVCRPAGWRAITPDPPRRGRFPPPGHTP